MHLKVEHAIGAAVLALGAGCSVADGPVGEQTGELAQACHRAAPELYTPPPNPAAREQMIELWMSGQFRDAALIHRMIKTPQAVWFTAGTPKSVKRDARKVVRRARHRGTPVLVAYNLPFRDCAQYSAGGATTVEEYQDWIDGFARGIGRSKAIVILEPDGLGIIPFYDPYGEADGSADMEWCQPEEADPETAAADRFAMMNYAVDALASRAPNAKVYLDATHSGWLGVGDAAERLALAGVDRAHGFFLNVSSYQLTPNLVQYGTWISQCLASGMPFFDCANQYWNGGPLPAKIAELLGEWTGGALDATDEWSDDSDVPELNTSGINARYAGITGEIPFVIDTSRNGQGPWTPDADYPDAQDWCNPPDRGLGLRPTTNTGIDLVDAYLWVKIPGESDGECLRGTAGSEDPARGMVDPSAGAWFPEMALELVHNANPPLF